MHTFPKLRPIQGLARCMILTCWVQPTRVSVKIMKLPKTSKKNTALENAVFLHPGRATAASRTIRNTKQSPGQFQKSTRKSTSRSTKMHREMKKAPKSNIKHRTTKQQAPRTAKKHRQKTASSRVHAMQHSNQKYIKHPSKTQHLRTHFCTLDRQRLHPAQSEAQKKQ